MRYRLRTLYTKIFLWFCLTVLATSVLVFAVAGMLGSQPFGQRWMALTQDLYAHSAVDFYTTGGPASLESYLEKLRGSLGVEGYLLGPDGRDVLRRELPGDLKPVVREAADLHGSAAHIGRVWSSASPVRAADGTRFVFVMQLHSMLRFVDGTFPRALGTRLLLGIAIAAVFCLLLARHITQPVRVLQAAAARLADGDLSVRARPAMGDRRDELSAMAEAFDRMAARLERLLRTQRQMLAELSHELRSPLTRVQVSLELLRRGETDVLPSIEADLERLNEIIGEVLALARMEVDPATPQREAVDVSTMVQSVCDDANRESRDSGRAITLELMPGCVVAGELGLLHRCVENVVRNALQHTAPGTDAAVSVQRVEAANSVVRVEVRDSGPGIPPQSLADVFEPFFRVPDSRSTHPEGAGLGLAIAARIAGRHGGTIVARNLEPHGLCVTIELPAAAMS